MYRVNRSCGSSCRAAPGIARAEPAARTGHRPEDPLPPSHAEHQYGRTARTSGPETRDKLIRAAEELFAAQGVDGAQLRDVTRLAGQANPSAVQYHFGSRAGLLGAVMAGRPAGPYRAGARLPRVRHRGRGTGTGRGARHRGGERAADRTRAPLPADLRAAQPRERHPLPHPALAGTAYWALIERLADRLAAGGLPEPLLLERVDLALTVVGAALADRARQYLAGAEPLTDEPLFLADLVETTTALLRAARSSSCSRTPPRT